jgi:N-acetylglutamate synthase-like GNAT family acetyltransferase
MPPFRRAKVADVPAINALINLAYQVEKFFKTGERTSVGEVAAMLDQSAFLVHEDEGKIVGCVHVMVKGERGYFGLLAVHPTKRGQKLGARLVAAAEGFCREAGCGAMDLTVVHLRTELPPYYRALGYRERTTAPFPYPDTATQPCHMIVMSKDL